MKINRLAYVVIMLFLSFLVVSCATSDKPAESAKEWYIAVNTMDALKADSLVCVAIQDEFRNQINLGSAFLQIGNMLLGDIKIEVDVSKVKFSTIDKKGDMAIVQAIGDMRGAVGGTVQSIYLDEEWLMAYEDGAWKWCGDNGLGTTPNTDSLKVGDSFGFEIGDSFTYVSRGHTIDNSPPSIYNYFYEVVGVENFDGHDSWIISEKNYSLSDNDYQKIWVDQTTGLILKIQWQRIYDSAIKMAVGNDKEADIVQMNFLGIYDLKTYEWNQTTERIAVNGDKYTDEAVFGPDIPVFFMSGDVDLLDLSPLNSTYSILIVQEQTITVPAGTFDCIVIKQGDLDEIGYVLRYFDKETGVEIKKESYIQAVEVNEQGNVVPIEGELMIRSTDELEQMLPKR